MGMIWIYAKPILLIILGLILLIKGADFLVSGSSTLAKRFHIPEIVVGLTIVSIGTSMPELFVSTTGSLQGHSDLAIGNVIGSNLANLLLILGFSAIIKPIRFLKNTKKYEIPFCLYATIIFALFCNFGKGITRLESLLLIFFFILFIGYTIWIANKNIDKEKEKDEKKGGVITTPVWKDILFIILGIVGLKFGGDLSVDNAVILAELVGLSEKIIGVTILAIGTSFPELVTSVTAAYKGEEDIAIGNIIGSNIFNLLLIVGVSAFISPITFNPAYNRDLIYLLISTSMLFLFPFIKPKNKMSKSNGIIYVLMYVIYLLMLIYVG